jgi:hypothetical protein
LHGGTAFNKLIFKPAVRYSEDIDLAEWAAAQLPLYTGNAYVLTVARVQGLRALGVP